MEQDLYRQLDTWHNNEEYQKIADEIFSIPKLEWDYKLIITLARALNNLGDYENAVKQLLSIEQQGKKDLLWFYRMGYALFYSDREEEAKKMFRRVLEFDPEDKDAIEFLKQCDYYIAQKKLQRQNWEEGIPPVDDPTYLLQDLASLITGIETEIQGDHLAIPSWDMEIYPQLEQLNNQGSIIYYYIYCPKWDREIFECSVGLGSSLKKSFDLSQSGFIFGLLDGIRAMMTESPSIKATSTFAGENHRWSVYHSNLTGIGKKEGEHVPGDFWRLLKDELKKRLGNQKICYVKVYGAKNGQSITGECRINDIVDTELSSMIADYVSGWKTDGFCSQKQFFIFRQEEETYIPYPHTKEQVKEYTRQAIELFYCYAKQQDYDSYMKKLFDLTRDMDLAEELYTFLPEMCAEVAFPKIKYPELVNFYQNGHESMSVYKTQLTSYYFIQEALLEELRKDTFPIELYQYFISASSIYNAICSAKKQGKELEDLEGSKISVLYGFSGSYQIR